MMKTRKPLALLLVVMLLAAMVPATAGAQGKSITIAFPQEPDNLNPMYTTMTFAGYTYQIFLAGAWDFDRDLNPHPVLVTEMPSLENGGISEDGTVLTINLRDDIQWSDGTPITSADFVFTYEMMMSDANSPLQRAPYDVVASVEAPDPTTVVVTFFEPYAPWAATLYQWVLPEHVLRPVFEADGTLDNAEWNRNPTVGSAAYVFDTWQVGSFVRFVRNDNYYNAPANIDTVVVSVVPDDQAYLAGLKNEDFDVGTFIAFSDIPELEATGNVTIDIRPSGYNEGWFLNVREGLGHPALQDVRVRKALAMGFNRWQITEDLLLGYTYPSASYWENMPAANPEIEPYPYDPEMAAQLLDDAGWVDTNGDGIRDKDGVELVLRFVTNMRQIRMDVQVVAQQALAELGVGIEIINYPSDIFFNSFADGGPTAIGDYDIGQWSSSVFFPDPEVTRFRCDQIPTEEKPVGGNWSGTCDPELDALFAEQARTVDYDARMAIFHQIDAKMYELATWIGIWYDADVWVINNRIQNAAVNGATPFWNIAEWDVAG